MNTNPVFPKPTRDSEASDYHRNWRCPKYDSCLTEASKTDLYLDCSECLCKNTDAMMIACNRSTADFIISSPLMEDQYEPVLKDYSKYIERELDGKWSRL